jgi:hypothetical protein
MHGLAQIEADKMNSYTSKMLRPINDEDISSRSIDKLIDYLSKKFSDNIDKIFSVNDFSDVVSMLPIDCPEENDDDPEIEDGKDDPTNLVNVAEEERTGLSSQVPKPSIDEGNNTPIRVLRHHPRLSLKICQSVNVAKWSK